MLKLYRAAVLFFSALMFFLPAAAEPGSAATNHDPAVSSFSVGQTAPSAKQHGKHRRRRKHPRRPA